MEEEIRKTEILEISDLTIWNTDFKENLADGLWIAISIANGFLEIVQQARNFIRVRGMHWVLDRVYN